MRKILIALLVVTMASSVMIAGCSNKSEDKNTSSGNSIASEESSSLSESSTEDSSSSFDSDSSKSESISSDSNEATDGDFVWEDGKYITDLSEEGAKKKEIVIPKKCQMFMMSDFQSGNFGDNDNLESIIFESDDIKDLPSGCFINDINLKKVELPEKLKKISEGARRRYRFNDFEMASWKISQLPRVKKPVGGKTAARINSSARVAE